MQANSVRFRLRTQRASAIGGNIQVHVGRLETEKLTRYDERWMGIFRHGTRPGWPSEKEGRVCRQPGDFGRIGGNQKGDPSSPEIDGAVPNGG